MGFNKKQIISTLLAAGPFAASLVLSKNSRLNGKNHKFFGVSGFLLAIIMYTITVFVIEKTIAKKGLLDDHLGLINIYAIAILFVVQFIYGIVLIPVLNNQTIKNTVATSQSSFRSAQIWPYVIAGIGLTALLILFGPFRFFFLLMYMVPHYYVYVRVSMAFTKRYSKRIIAIMLTGLMLLFPVVEIIYNFNNNVLVRFLLQVSYFYLPFILHFLIGLVIYDITASMIIKLKVIYGSRIYNTKNWKTAMALLATLAVIIVVIAHVNFNAPSYTHYHLSVPAKSSELDSLKVVVASDFHFAEVTRKRFVTRFIEKVNDLQADVVLLPGDIVESDNDNDDMRAIARELTQLKATYGVFGSLGNHEYYGDLNQNIRFCENADIKMLMDTAVVLNNAIIIAGQNDQHDDNRKSLEKILAPVSDNLPVIFMRHRPVNYEEVSAEKVDIMVSGHTHHGQLFPFNFLTKMSYELSWGHAEINNTHFLTTCGAQGWGPQTRTTGKSEIMVLHVTFTR